MSSLIKAASVVFLSVLSAHLSARSYMSYACDGLSESWAILPCTQDKRIESDNGLNKSYVAARKRIHKYNGSDEESLKLYLDKLKHSQRAWIRFRDENCALEAFEFEQGSVMDSVAKNLCAAGMSDERAKFLDEVGRD